MPNPTNKPTEQKIKTKTTLDEQIKVAHEVLWAVCAFLVFIAVASLMPKARPPVVPPVPEVTEEEIDEDSRHLIAVAQGNDKIFLSWRLFSTDPPDVGFDVYRSISEGGTYTRINNLGPITTSTNYRDDTATSGLTYYYKVKSAASSNYSNIVKETAVSGTLPDVNYNRYLWLETSVPPTHSTWGPVIGDLDNDGLLDYVIRDNNNVGEDNPNNTMKLRAIKNDGTTLWDFDTGYYFRRWYIDPPGQYYNEEGGVLLPNTVWDFNNNGKAEVIVRTDNGPFNDADVNLTYLTLIRDGNPANGTTSIPLPYPTGYALQQEKHPADGDDPAHVNLPHYIAIAYLDGKDNPPQIIVQIAVHDGESLIAYNVNPATLELTERWLFENEEEDDGPNGTSGSGTHGVPIYDMDGDGKDEVFDGSTLLRDDSDGDGEPEVLWTARSVSDGRRLGHPDVVIAGDILPSNSGPEVWMVSEGWPQGVTLVDENGHVIWEERQNPWGQTWTHGDHGWVANLTNDLEGYELLGWNVPYMGNTGNEFIRIFDAGYEEGIIYEENPLSEQTDFDKVIEWDGDDETEVFNQAEKRIENARFQDGELVFYTEPNPYVNISPSDYGLRADIIGDYREEFIYSGGSNPKLRIITSTDVISSRKVSRWENLEYRKSAARVGGSYWMYYGPIDFEELPPSNQPPVADISSPQNNSEFAVGESITFDGSTSYDTDGSITNYNWNFGNGDTRNGAVVTYSYSNPGDYSVILTVTDDDGATDTASVTVKVIQGSPPLDLTLSGAPSVPQGEIYTLTTSVQNNTQDIQTVDVSYNLTFPSGADRDDPVGPYLGFEIDSGQTWQVNDQFDVDTPLGVYTFSATLRDHENQTILDTDTLNVEVTEPEDPYYRQEREPEFRIIGSTTYLWREAERATITPPMERAEDPEASDGAYILVPNGAGENGMAQYNINIPEAGDYIIWGRVLALNGEDDSFWVSVDQGVENLWDLTRSSSWTWDEVSNRNGADPVIFNLTQGTHTLYVGQREDGAKLDELLITNDLDYEPTGLGE